MTDLFFHVRIVISIVTGLALTRLIGGIARIVQHPQRKPVDAVHLLWTASIFLSVVHFWWWEFRLDHVEWRFLLYLFVIFYAGLLFSLAALLLPEDMSDYADYRTYFLSRRKWFFGILALVYVVDVADTLMKGSDYLQSLGPEYFAQAAAYLILSLVAIAVTDRRFQMAFVCLNLVYQISFILRFYERLG